MSISISQADEKEAARLTQIAFAAKSYWKYPKEYLKLWKSELTITPSYIQRNTVLKAVNEKKHILGVGAIEYSTVLDAYEIGHFWIAPTYIGQGIGSRLLIALIRFAKKAGIKQLYSVADPNALGFYKKMGFTLIGKQESKPVGRYLPVLVLEIE